MLRCVLRIFLFTLKWKAEKIWSGCFRRRYINSYKVTSGRNSIFKALWNIGLWAPRPGPFSVEISRLLRLIRLYLLDYISRARWEEFVGEKKVHSATFSYFSVDGFLSIRAFAVCPTETVCLWFRRVSSRLCASYSLLYCVYCNLRFFCNLKILRIRYSPPFDANLEN